MHLKKGFMTKKQHLQLIIILGSLAALGPFSIDMYLPGFDAIASDLNTTVPNVSLSLSSFFVGISLGQLLYGPLLDKFGRKKPLYIGLAIYIIASLGCLFVRDINQLILLRFVQAIGSCAAAVASIAMVRDFFDVKDSPKVFAHLMLVIALSPMLAPTAGGYLIEYVGWQYVFVFLAFMALLLLLASYFYLPDRFKPDPAYSLKPAPMLKKFVSVMVKPQFYTYALITSFSFAGLFAYVSASPMVFMNLYGLSKTGYGWIFALLSVAFIGSSQINSLILRWHSSEKIVKWALWAQGLFSLLFLLASLNDLLNLYSTVAFIALFLACLGLINPNAAALSLAPFSKDAGTASALLGAFEMGLGALASFAVSLFPVHSTLPMPLIMTIVVFSALILLFFGSNVLSRSQHSSKKLKHL